MISFKMMLKTQVYGLHFEGFAKYNAVWTMMTSLMERRAPLRFVWIIGLAPLSGKWEHLQFMVSGW